MATVSLDDVYRWSISPSETRRAVSNGRAGAWVHRFPGCGEKAVRRVCNNRAFPSFFFTPDSETLFGICARSQDDWGHTGGLKIPVGKGWGGAGGMCEC